MANFDKKNNFYILYPKREFPSGVEGEKGCSLSWIFKCVADAVAVATASAANNIWILKRFYSSAMPSILKIWISNSSIFKFYFYLATATRSQFDLKIDIRLATTATH